MSPRRARIKLVLFSLAIMLALSCRLMEDIGAQPTATASPVAPSEPATATSTSVPTTSVEPIEPSDTATAVVVITFTLTQEPYPGPSTEGPPQTINPYPGPGVTTSPIAPLPTFPLPGTSTVLALTPTTTLTPFGSITPSVTSSPVFVSTPTPTLPAFINLNGLWYGERKIELKNRFCEETIYHSLRWRIEQDRNYNLLVNDDLSGKLSGHVVTLSGTEYFEGGTLDLYYILKVGPTEHRLSGYFYGRAVLPKMCDRDGNVQLSVPDGWIEVLR